MRRTTWFVAGSLGVAAVVGGAVMAAADTPDGDRSLGPAVSTTPGPIETATIGCGCDFCSSST